VPRHSSERREFIPIGFLSPDVIVGDANLCIPAATLFHFGVTTSRMHMAWVKYVCGRIKSDYRYTNSIVYNNFPWPGWESKEALPSDPRSEIAIKIAAQEVLDARAACKGQTLADLYDPDVMPPALRKAHQKLDKAVDAAYGYKGARDDAARVAFLFGLYQQLTGATAVAAPVKSVTPRKSKRAAV
jgi:hypothetical protein